MMMRSVGQKLFSTASRRSMSTQQQFAPFQGMYSTFFRSNLSYVTFVIVGAMAFEGVYGTFGDMVWEMNNRGVSVSL